MNESILFYISAIGLPSVWMIVAIYIAYLLDKLFSRETKP